MPPTKNLPATRSPTTPAPLALTGLQDVLTLGEVLAKSGFFNDARTSAQAVVKVLAGRELGFQTIASMVGVHVIEGKPAIGAHLMASMVKRSGKYDYKVLKCDREACKLQFLVKAGEAWEVLGEVEMTMKEAVETGLALANQGKGVKVGDLWIKSNWARSADDMLFARCVSKGFRRWCPDLTAGAAVYVPDEIEVSPPEIERLQPRSVTIEEDDSPPPAETPVAPSPAAEPPPAEQPVPIAEAQVAEIGELIRRTNADVARFLSYFKIQTVRQMTPQQYGFAKKMLEEKLAKMAKGA